MAIKDIVKGICNITRCKYDVYTKERTDELLEEINSNVYTKTETDYKFSTKNITTTGTDLNNYIANGTYFFNNAADPANKPLSGAGWLEVIARNENDIKQIWYGYNKNTNIKFERIREAGTWGEWKKFITEDFITSGTSNPSGGNDGDIYFQYQ